MSIYRQPIASGRFYSSNAKELSRDLIELFNEAEVLVPNQTNEEEELLALVAPHAGYVYSGIVAASAFAKLKLIKPRKRVFLIGSSHCTKFRGASIYNMGNYSTPLGKVKVDLETANDLIDNDAYFNYVNEAHSEEHCLEVLLPFLQHVWGDNFEIVPIIIGTQNKDICTYFSEILRPWFNAENLFVISTDLSHYPGYEDAIEIDKKTIDAVLSGKPHELMAQLNENENARINKLSTSMCGWTSVYTLMRLAETNTDVHIDPILYQNSGDAKLIGEKERVVGYQSMAVYKKSSSFRLSKEDSETLIKISHESINLYSKRREKLDIDSNIFSENLQTETGGFVSIYLNNELRGCIGNIESYGKSLIELIADVAISAAFHDNRFPPLQSEDIVQLKIEISVLTPLKQIHSLDEFELGRHGILIRKGQKSGTYLPQVAEKTDWTKEEFIQHCSKDKAGIGKDGWKEADLFVYEAIIINEE